VRDYVIDHLGDEASGILQIIEYEGTALVTSSPQAAQQLSQG
jgi:hypothetical protein